MPAQGPTDPATATAPPAGYAQSFQPQPVNAAPLLELQGITRRFGSTLALDNVSLQIQSGQIMGLLGENGAGKSTLMNVLFGLLQPDAGQIRYQGQPARFRGPADALQRGVCMVHQHFKLIDRLSVAQNAMLGMPMPFWLRQSAMNRTVLDACRRFRLQLDPAAPVESLGVGERQRVEILKALLRNVRLLILDEPTAVLTQAEAQELFQVVRKLARGGCAVILITHRLAEVTAVCQRVAILRRGKLVDQQAITPQTSTARLAAAMVGAQSPTMVHGELPAARASQPLDEHRSSPQPAAASVHVAPQAPTRAARLSVSGLHLPGPRGRPHLLQNIQFQIPAGRVLGIAGVDGNGQRELCESICGLLPATGTVQLDGRELSNLSPRKRFQAGLAHIPDDRQTEGLALDLSLAENLISKTHASPPFARYALLNRSAIRSAASDAIQRFDIRANGPDAPAASLSGGNQQRVILAREIARATPKALIAMNPARGLDVAATAFVYRQIYQLAQAGTAVLLVCADLDELYAAVDDLLVMHAGRLVSVPQWRIDRAAVGHAMLAGAAHLPHESTQEVNA